ncbi:MAG TPA: hypothetical protein VLM39_05195 [Ignavibacteriaceae bacterium]|nr:hypothetical protein [Ignavibacteriaceae bacterium]
MVKHLKKSYEKKDNDLWKHFSLSIKGTGIKEENSETSKIEFLSLQIQALRDELREIFVEPVTNFPPDSISDFEDLYFNLLARGVPETEITEKYFIPVSLVNFFRGKWMNRLKLHEFEELIHYAKIREAKKTLKMKEQ